MGVVTDVVKRVVEPLPRFAVKPVAVVVAVQVVVLTALSGRYGFHRDELYFIAAGNRPAWGYVDQPPITPILARISTGLFGDTQMGLRVLATLIGAATVVVVALIARECGGDRTVQWLTATAAAVSTYALVSTHMLVTNTADLIVWTVVALLALRLLRTGDGRWWLALGAAVGVGMANKWLILVLLAALGTSVLAVGPRAVLRSWWLAGGVGVALVVMAPVVIWQAAHGFPLLTVATGISADDGGENRALLVPMQLVYVLPALVPVWIAGIVRPWRDPALRWAKAVSLSYPVLCVILLALGGKPYYAAPLLLVLTAMGAAPALRWFRDTTRTAWRRAAAVFMAVSVVVSLLIGLPLLPPSAIGPVLAMNKEPGEQMGWPAFVGNVAAVWRQIPAGERAHAVIFAQNYGETGAIEHYRGDYGLPQPYSGHMSYADWGPPPDSSTGPVLLIAHFKDDIGRTEVLHDFTGCRLVARNDNGLGVDNDEQGAQLMLCTATTAPWSRIWPDLRRYY